MAGTHSRYGNLRTQLRVVWLVTTFAVLLAPAGNLLFGSLQKTSKTENRALATKIKLPKKPGDFTLFRTSLDNVLRDQLVFRDGFAKLRVAAARYVGLATTRKVIRGRDGWLFGNLNNSLNDLRGFGRLNRNAARRLADKLDRTAAFFAKRNIPFFFGIAPNKASIYAEKLPSWIRPAPLEQTNLGRLHSALEHRSGLLERFIRLRRPLLRARPHGTLYQRTDTHWNSRGAFEAYLKFAPPIAAATSKFVPLSRADIRFVARQKVGDLQKMMDPWSAPTLLPNARIISKVPAKPFKQQAHIVETREHGKQRVTVFDQLNSGSARPDSTLLFIGDSFGLYMNFFWTQGFRRVVFVHHQHGAWPPGIVDKFNPTVVVLLIVERNLPDYVRGR